jgi:hypothetical protein
MFDFYASNGNENVLRMRELIIFSLCSIHVNRADVAAGRRVAVTVIRTAVP